jgi:iron complex outermembrane receptor protein
VERSRNRIWLAGVAAVALHGSAAWAQDGAEIDEVVVTAQKRAQAVDDVGLSVQAISAEQAANRGVKDVSDLARLVPGFTATPSPYATPVYTLRGVGLYDSGLASAPSVTVYVDEAPLPFPIMTKAASLDIERVEVLKGPQGTLFGQSSTGGAVNYIAAKPTPDFRAGGQLELNHFGQADLSGFASGPLAETVGARLALRVVQGGAWQKSTSRDDELGDADRYEGRLLVDWRPAEGTRLRLNLNGFIDRSDPLAPSLLQVQPLNPALLAPGFADSYTAREPNDADWPAGQPRTDNRFWQAAIRAEQDLGEAATLTVLASKARAELDQDLPFSGTPLPYQNLKDVGYVESFSGEARLSGAAGDLNWLVGVSYEGFEADDRIRYDQRLVSNRQPLPFVPPYKDAVTQLTSSGDGWAAFGNLDYRLSPVLGLRAGLRYSSSESSGRGCTFDDQASNELGQLIEVLQTLIDGTARAVPPGGCLSLDAAGDPSAADLKLDDDNLSWRLGLDWNVSPDILAFANYSRGYKAGIFPNVAGTRVAQYDPAQVERLDAYEVGVKASLFERRLQLNLAGFYYDYKDKQFRGTVLDPLFGKLERELNIPRSEVLGLEAEMTARPMRGLTLTGGLVVLDTKVTRDFETFTSDGVLLNARGSRLPFTPNWQLTGDAAYEWPVRDGLNGFVGAGWTYHSGDNASLRTATVRADEFAIKEYLLVDLRAGVEADDGRWRLSAFVRNAGDAYHWNTVFRVIDGYFRYNGQPRTFGLALTLRTP